MKVIDFNVSSSFSANEVKPINDRGNGEAKLYSQNDDDVLDLIGFEQDKKDGTKFTDIKHYKFKVDQEKFIFYMNQVKVAYIYNAPIKFKGPFKDGLNIDYWNKKFDQISSLSNSELELSYFRPFVGKKDIGKTMSLS